MTKSTQISSASTGTRRKELRYAVNVVLATPSKTQSEPLVRHLPQLIHPRSLIKIGLSDGLDETPHKQMQ